jgi:hypothetical protein
VGPIPIARLGEIGGRITWGRNQLPVAPGTAVSANAAIEIRPFTVTVIPSTEIGQFGSTTTEFIVPSGVEFSELSSTGDEISVRYVVSGLPFDIDIQLRVSPRLGDLESTFVRIGGPLSVLLDFGQISVSDFDFTYLERPS